MIAAALEQARMAGQRYEASLAEKQPALRKANGIYYTPPAIVDHVVRHTLGPALQQIKANGPPQISVLDPACGCGAFLLAAHRYLLESRHQSGPLARICGVDRDPAAVRMARAALAHAIGTNRQAALALKQNIKPANALVSDWAKIFPHAGGFDVVLGNPPWGQKEIGKDDRLKQRLWQRFPSSAGIFDLFRPFVELGVRLTKNGGWFGMVLPDIVLLKDYPQTRRFLLEYLTLERIDTWGMAFTGAVIDVVTIIGRKGPARAGHRVRIGSEGKETKTIGPIPQADFLANPRYTFNLSLTPRRRRLLDRLANCPRLGDYFEVHEGVHSGNIRAELFVTERLDASCRELLFGRDEIRPYELRWRGRYVRLAAVPARKTRARYANVGRAEWHEQPKVLVRRTGDHVLAAMDRKGRYASNNFFLVFPKKKCGLDLDGLCALLNSEFMTWHFKAIEPRQGRVFAELKIKHLATFPLPARALTARGCRQLNRLGHHSAALQQHAAIDAEVLRLFGLRPEDIQ
jgi:tRNA1(Val) A37 N6-methylase TrmN6